MNFIGPIIRLVCGLALVVVATVRYFNIRAQMAEAEGGAVQIFGFTATSESWQVGFIFAIALIIGLALVALGGFGIMKKLQEA